MPAPGGETLDSSPTEYASMYSLSMDPQVRVPGHSASGARRGGVRRVQHGVQHGGL